MKRNNIILVVLMSILLFTSCKEYLDLKPYGKTIPTSADEFSSILHNILRDIDYGTDQVIIGNSGSVTDYACYADNLDASLTDRESRGLLSMYIGNRINNYQTLYGNLYAKIRDCNIILNRITDADKKTELGQEVLGTAYAMRAVCYYNLVRLYTEPYEKTRANKQLGVPKVDQFDMLERPLRDNLQSTIDFIVSDLKKAIKYNVTKDVYSFTVDVAKAYLAKTYFWSEDWDNAIVVADELLKKYPLIEGEEYKEMIQDRYNKKGNVVLRSYVYPGENDLSYTTEITSIKKMPASKEFVELFVEKDDDIRYALSFNKKRENQKNPCARIRSAEFCLILAEAYAHKSGGEAKALEYLNMLRAKRISPYTNYTIGSLPVVNVNYLIKEDAEGGALTPLMYSILIERQKELYMEMDRFFELKRNGRPYFWVAANGLKYEMYEFLYTMPLPQSDISLIKGLKQNKGYELN